MHCRTTGVLVQELNPKIFKGSSFWKEKVDTMEKEGAKETDKMGTQILAGRQ